MHTTQQPPWLQGLITLGRLGDYFQFSTEPLPTGILWIEVDASKRLVRFIVQTT